MEIDIEWKKIELKDREMIKSYFAKEEVKTCEYTFANNYLWREVYDIRYAIINDLLVFKLGDEDLSVSYPVGSSKSGHEDTKKAIEILIRYFEERDKPFKMYLVSKQKFKQLEELFPGRFRVKYNRDLADYIYETDKLITLSGKKLHSKRNHINKFKNMYSDWQYEVITDENVEECLEMAREWCRINDCMNDEGKRDEIGVTLRALELRDELGLIGGLIRLEGRVIAITLGEPCCEKTFVVHIEKAFSDIQGTYPLINQEFLMHEAMDYKYVNREEDTGDEGLRKAKLSYRPVHLEEKGIVTLL